MAYLDDILMVANTLEELVERTRKVGNQIEEVGLKLNLSKSIETVQTVDWLGYQLSEEGIRQSPKRFRAFES